MNDNRPKPPPAAMVRIVGAIVGDGRVVPNAHFPSPPSRRPALKVVKPEA